MLGPVFTVTKMSPQLWKVVYDLATTGQQVTGFTRTTVFGYDWGVD